MRHILYYITISFFFISCTDKNEAMKLNELKECINDELNKEADLIGMKRINFYQLIYDFEKKLISSRSLNKISKEDYLNLFINIVEKKKDYYEIYNGMNKIIDSYGFTEYSTEYIFNRCPYLVSNTSKNKEGIFIYRQGEKLNNMLAQGFDNINLITEFINVTDNKRFENIIYRAPTILLVMINLDMKYNKSKWNKIDIEN